MEKHGFIGGIKGLVELAEKTGKEQGIEVSATTDAKYLEVGISSKSDNVNVLYGFFRDEYGIADQNVHFGATSISASGKESMAAIVL